MDVSPVGLGAMLTLKERDGHIPVTYISRSLSPVEQRYSQTEREAMAIRWPCERLRLHLAGAQFQVITYQKSLEAIFSNSNSKPPVRIERWSTYLQEFNFTVEYRPGKDNPADYVSRPQYVHQKIRLTTRSRSRRRKLCIPLLEETYQNRSRSRKSEQLPRMILSYWRIWTLCRMVMGYLDIRWRI